MILALLGALVIGISLGLLGSGGSVITVPVLVFILQRPEKLAIAESLAIVGSVALIGSIPYMLRAQVKWKSILIFGLPGMFGACLGGYGTYYINGTIQLTLFGIMMLFIAGLMLSNQSFFNQASVIHQPVGLIILEGFLIGTLTGFIGIGGGFIIVPSLVLLCNLSIPFAIGTSLVIISMNAFSGFLDQFFFLKAMHLSVDWTVITMMSSFAIFGSLSGSWIGPKISQIYLRKAFGFSVLMMGSYIIFKNFL